MNTLKKVGEHANHHTCQLVFEKRNLVTLLKYVKDLYLKGKYLITMKIIYEQGAGPGLVVMEGDLHSEGCGFKSRHLILDGHFHMYLL